MLVGATPLAPTRLTWTSNEADFPTCGASMGELAHRFGTTVELAA
jgi:hypothetical protein